MLGAVGVAVVGLAFAVGASSQAQLAFGLGLMVPGSGFAAPMLASGGVQPGALAATLAAIATFGAALLLWFGTGNVLAPPIAWLGSAALAGWSASGVAADISPLALLPFAASVPALLLASRLVATVHRPVAPVALPPLAATVPAGELDLPTLRLQRLLLDRALQPVERFDGFEWRDQFQTAAVRYQLNFLSYALSLAQAHHTPAFTGYVVEAQRRLLAKQSDPRIWRYWRLESAWGHLKPAADPVPRDNIMYSGFIAAQIAYAEAAAGRSIAPGATHLDLRTSRGARVTYDLGDLTRLLADQYRRAPWGLLACEPHWIYPLCNLITASALRIADPTRWQAVAPGFRDGLLREFIASDGGIVPFRSSLTGLAPPAVGGIVMQAFPCLFLNALFPDLAARQWDRVRQTLASRRWARAFWPVDVGNYGFSRASSLAASAAAAVEMGDGESAAAMLAMLDRECPATEVAGVRHRPRASLWAHALELAARCNRQDGLARLGSDRPARGQPHLADAPYPHVLVARAVAHDGRLDLVLHPGGGDPASVLRFAGLRPGRHYRVTGADPGFLRADGSGAASLAITLTGRAEFALVPVV